MDATELMIGDWVRFNTEPKFAFRMQDVSGSSLFRRWTNDGICVPYGYSEIEPIPLTPDILIKNGAIFENGYKYSFTDIDNEVYFIFNDGGAGVIHIESLVGFIPLHLHLLIKYVHELQHALRLCGIKKEIIL